MHVPNQQKEVSTSDKGVTQPLSPDQTHPHAYTNFNEIAYEIISYHRRSLLCSKSNQKAIFLDVMPRKHLKNQTVLSHQTGVVGASHDQEQLEQPLLSSRVGAAMAGRSHTNPTSSSRPGAVISPSTLLSGSSPQQLAIAAAAREWRDWGI